MNPLQEHDKCLLDSTFQQSSIRFSCNTSRSAKIDLATSLYFSGTRSVSSFVRHAELNSRIIVMTTIAMTLDRPKVGTEFSVICWFCQLRLSRFTMKLSAEIFAPYGWFRIWSKFPEFVVTSRQFCGASASNSLNSSMSAIRISTFKILPRSVRS